ncbi:MAG: STAS domain-containing protein [Bdellovibrionales bacterium]|nr:STAS domain-containing protein [Bdellovibrionales bacterium]
MSTFSSIQNQNAWSIRREKDWVIVSVLGRVDSFNYESFCMQIVALVEEGCLQIALDLSQAKFLSLPSIRFVHAVAGQLKDKKGHLALLSASEKLKRQIDIYGSLRPMEVYRSEAELA